VKIGCFSFITPLFTQNSKHTSIQQRIHTFIKGEQPKTLMPFVVNPRQNMPKGIAYNLINYCELVEGTGRSIREDKAGYIEHRQSPCHVISATHP
jgi:hypothetical protein